MASQARTKLEARDPQPVLARRLWFELHGGSISAKTTQGKVWRRELKRMQHLAEGVAAVEERFHLRGTSLEDELTRRTNWTPSRKW